MYKLHPCLPYYHSVLCRPICFYGLTFQCQHPSSLWHNNILLCELTNLFRIASHFPSFVQTYDTDVSYWNGCTHVSWWTNIVLNVPKCSFLPHLTGSEPDGETVCNCVTLYVWVRLPLRALSGDTVGQWGQLWATNRAMFWTKWTMDTLHHRHLVSQCPCPMDIGPLHIGPIGPCAHGTIVHWTNDHGYTWRLGPWDIGPLDHCTQRRFGQWTLYMDHWPTELVHWHWPVTWTIDAGQWHW